MPMDLVGSQPDDKEETCQVVCKAVWPLQLS
jgi:hypothetical protein